MFGFFCPEPGDIVEILSDKEVSVFGYVLSSFLYQKKTGFVVLALVSKESISSPFAVPAPFRGYLDAVIFADRVKTFSWRSEKMKLLDKTSVATLHSVRSLFLSLFSS